MADKNIGLLPQASTLTDDSSFVCEDSGTAKRVTGKQFKDFAKEGASPAVEEAENAADRAEAALKKAPKIQNGTWWVFDASSQAYVDTGVKAQGERGIQGERGETGEPGQPGEKGDPFRYEDFTPEQLDDLERGAKAAQAAAETAAASAATSAGQASVSEQNAAGSASAAKASEDAAKVYKTTAAGSASSAQESAASASASASEASASATAAAESETSAIEAKTAAETAKTEAGKSASAAKKSETASKASETAAAGSAYAAQQSASAAEGSATSAAQSADSIGNAEQVVTQKAEEASASAESAAASAEAAAKSAEHAEQVVGGDFATKTEAKGYANTAESNAKAYADQQIAAIPAPDIPTKVSELENDSGYLTSYTETDPTVPAWAKAPTKPTYTASEVGADASGTAAAVQRNLEGHTGNTTVHITASDRTGWNGKQDKLTGTQGQVVGFDENGNAVAQNAPSGGGMTEEAADGKYLKLAGGDMSGKLTAPKIETGSGNTNYFQSRKFRGEGDANTYYHAIDFGYKNHDQVDFHEYGGKWNFYKNQSGKVNEGVLCGSITSNGWEGRAKLKSGSTMVTSQLTENSDAIATTAFVHGLVDMGKAVSFTVTLTAGGWSGNAQTVSNSKFITSGYAYTVCPAGDSFAGYAEAVIYADDVTTAGKMTFHCNEAPTINLTVNILRTEVTA